MKIKNVLLKFLYFVKNKILTIILTIILSFFLIFTLTGCATISNKENIDKLDIIASQDIKKEYELPLLTECEKPRNWNGTFEDLFDLSLEMKKILKECEQYNNEKKEWIERNFKK